MDFAPTEEQAAIQATARDYGQRALAPKAASRDATSEFPERELRELGKLGLLGINVPDALGGAEAGAVAYSLAIQELASADASVAVAVGVTNMVAELIAGNAHAELARRWVPRLVAGELVCGAFALSEPDAGSDPAAMRTRAVQLPSGEWSISGTKQWITSGDHSGVMVVWAITDPEVPGHKGISAFVIDGVAKGVAVARIEDKLGLHGSTTAQLVFDGAVVPADAMLGAPGAGFGLAMQALDGGRIGIASQACGIARFALGEAVRYAGERRTFGQAIIKHQAVGNMLADAATWLDAATLMTLRAAEMKQRKLPFSKEAAMAKLFASERAWQICDIALQVHGGAGYVREFPVERALRDVRVTRIYEGTSEIQRLVIARGLARQA